MTKAKVEFEGAEAIGETEMALKVRLDDGREIWFPKSQIDDDSEVFDADGNSTGTLVVSEWIALQKGLV